MSLPKPKAPGVRATNQEPDTLVEIKVVLAVRKVEIPEIREQVIKRGAYHVIEEWGSQIIEEVVTPVRGIYALELGKGK